MPTPTKILAWLHVTLGGIGLTGVLIMLALMAPRLDSRNLQTYQFIGFVLLVISVVCLIPSMAGGIGLLGRRRWAWPLMIVQSVLLLPLIPFGTALGGYGLWVLLAKDKRPAHAGRAAIDTTGPISRVPAWLSRNGALLLAMAGVGAGFAVMLQAGFWFNHQIAPAVITSVFPFAVVTLVVMVGLMASGNWPKHGRVQQPFFQSGQLRELLPQKSNAAFEQAGRERLAQLAADPARRKYVALIEAGEYWPAERIAYAEDADRVATCMHLQPVERAMRGAGIEVRFQSALDVKAACRIHHAALKGQFGPALSALYDESERHQVDRAYLDPKTASFRCVPCGSNIIVIHPLEAQPHTPWFPPHDTNAPVAAPVSPS